MHRLILFSKGDDHHSPPVQEKVLDRNLTEAILALLERQAHLERVIQEIRVSIAEAREIQETSAEKLNSRIVQLQANTRQLHHVTQAILKSRTWRALIFVGDLLLRMYSAMERLLPGKRAAVSIRTASTENFLEIGCDEPAPSADSGKTQSISGLIVVRGWALPASSVQRVEIQAGDAAPIEARYGLYRPDVADQFPDISGSDRSGFRASLDTTTLANGRQSIKIRAFNAAGGKAEIRVPILVDHLHGYASDHHRWIAEFEKQDAALIQMKLPLFALRPLVSVLVPVYRTAPEILERAIHSVMKQSYPNWELCIADDGSQSSQIDAILDRYALADQRVKVARLPANQGISAASNKALEMATGEFVALLDHDDELAEHALAFFIDALNRNPEADIFYSDQDHIDETGFRSDPFFKPDWSPDLILSENYVNHLMIFRRDLGLAVGGFRSEFDFSQDHDILLRMSHKALKIIHIPKILYHWRTDLYLMHRASNQQDRALSSSRRVIVDYLHASGIQATVESGEVVPRWRVRYAIPEELRVRIIVPCGGKVDLLDRCLKSLVEKTDYPHYEIVVVDNSRATKVETFVRSWSRNGRRANHLDFRYRPFNFSAMNNAAARDCDAPLLLFLNDDVSVITPDWLTAMVELTSRPGVGAVGAKLLYPDETIQHAGVVLGLFDCCGHAFRGAHNDERIYFDFPDVIRNVSAVTAACMMVPTKLFWECDGFDEESLPVAYQDVDLCLKLQEKGYRVLFTPHAKLYHFEAISKRIEDKDPRPAEALAFKTRWKKVIENDPFYSPNLTRTAENYSYRKKSLADA